MSVVESEMMTDHILSVLSVGGGAAEEVNSSNFILFKPSHVSVLRNPPFSICGRFVGTEQTPPFRLNRFELGMLVEKSAELGWRLQVVSSARSTCRGDRCRWPDMRSSYESYLARTIEQQASQFRLQRYNQLLAMKDKIIRGKRAKLNEKLRKVDKELQDASDPGVIQQLNESRAQVLSDLGSLEANFEQELEALKSRTQKEGEDEINKKLKENRLIEIFVETPSFLTSSWPASPIDTGPWLESVNETCKYKAFKHFTAIGYCLTGGTKFGGDFLVYPGDPARYHSKFILVCFDSIDEYRSIRVRQLVTYARMATSVKKTFLFAVPASRELRHLTSPLSSSSIAKLNQNSELHFLSVNWSHL